MTEYPSISSVLASSRCIPDSFDLLLDNGSEKTRVVHCYRTIRWIHGKRLVCKGIWQSREVFVKLFFSYTKASHNWRKEITGIEAMQRHGIFAPEIAHRGTAEKGKIHVLLLHPVDDGQSMETLWNRCRVDSEKVTLLQKFAGVLAQHHEAGIIQRDLHLKNFLFSAGKIFTLDGGDVEVTSKPVCAKRSLANLGLLFAQLSPVNDRFIPTVFSTYLHHRNLETESDLDAVLLSHVAYCRQIRLKKYLRKIFRECTEFICKRTFHRYMLWRRDFDSPELRRFLASPDDSLFFPGTTVMKKGNSSTVWLAEVGSRQLVVKRYNIKNFWHGMKRGPRKSRAAVSWKAAYMLRSYGIQTPLPVAMIEERNGPFRLRAYYVTCYIDSVDAARWFRDEQDSGKHKEMMADKIYKMFKVLRRFRIAHGDMKATNIFITPDGPALIDLDSMHRFRTRLFFRRSHQRDVHRFLKNWKDAPALFEVFRELFK